MSLLGFSSFASKNASASPLHLQAMRAYQLGVAGLLVRGQRRLEKLLASLPRESPTSDRAQLLFFSGMLARLEGDGLLAGRRLADAAEHFQAIGDGSSTALGLALAVEALGAAGKIDAGQELLSAWSERSGKSSTHLDPALALLQGARGSLAEASQLWELSGRQSWTEPARSWFELFRLETLLEREAVESSAEAIDRLVEELERRQTFDELYVRTLCLRARAAVESLAAPADRTSEPQRRADRLVREAHACSVSFGRYQGVLAALKARLAVYTGEDPAAHFERAVSALEQCGAMLDLARMLDSHAKLVQARLGQRVHPLISRSRDLFSRAGADARLQVAARGSGEDMRGSVFSGSIAMSRSMFGVALPGQDVELQAVFRVNEAITSVLNVDELLQRLLDEVVKVLKAERGAVVRRNADGTLTCVAARGLLPSEVREGNEGISFGVFREVEKSGAVVLADNAQLDDRFRGRVSVMASDIRSLMCAPLRTPKALHGFLYLDSTLSSRVFKEAHRELFQVFAAQAAIALENALAFRDLEQLNASLEARVAERTAELERNLEDLKNTRLKLLEAQTKAMEQEMRVAQEIQRRIIPAAEPLARPGLVVVGRLAPATQVGGDFWTLIDLPGNRTLLLVGDVTGHGVGAGMLTTVAKACCDTLVSRERDLDLITLVATLSEVIATSAKGEHAMTAFVALVDPAAKSLTFVNAGHEPPFYCQRADGLWRLEIIGGGAGHRLGEPADAPLVARSRSWSPGDRMLLFTDGLKECTDAGGVAFGRRNLRNAFLEGMEVPPAEHLQRVLDAAYRHFGAHPREDDVTAIVVEFQSPPG